MIDFHALNRQKNLWLREQKRRLALFLLDQKNPSIFTSEETKNLHKILILRNDNKLGDMIVTSFVIRELKKQLPNAEISVLAGPASGQLLVKNPYVNHIYIGENKLWQMYRLGRKLAKEHFDLFVDFDRKNSAATLLLLRLLHPRFAFGFNREGVQLYNLSVPLDYDAFHITQWYEKLFKALGLQLKNFHYDLFLPEKESKETMDFLAPYMPFIAINPLAASKHRCFSWKQVCTVAEAFPRYNIVLLGKVSQIQAFIKGKNKPKNLISLPYSFGLFHNLATLKQSLLLITPDTMYVHAAVALQKPLVALYKGTPETQSWAPQNIPFKVFVTKEDFSQFDIWFLIDAAHTLLRQLHR